MPLQERTSQPRRGHVAPAWPPCSVGRRRFHVFRGREDACGSLSPPGSRVAGVVAGRSVSPRPLRSAAFSPVRPSPRVQRPDPPVPQGPALSPQVSLRFVRTDEVHVCHSAVTPPRSSPSSIVKRTDCPPALLPGLPASCSWGAPQHGPVRPVLCPLGAGAGWAGPGAQPPACACGCPSATPLRRHLAAWAAVKPAASMILAPPPAVPPRSGALRTSSCLNSNRFS